MTTKQGCVFDIPKGMLNDCTILEPALLAQVKGMEDRQRIVLAEKLQRWADQLRLSVGTIQTSRDECHNRRLN